VPATRRLEQCAAGNSRRQIKIETQCDFFWISTALNLPATQGVGWRSTSAAQACAAHRGNPNDVLHRSIRKPPPSSTLAVRKPAARLAIALGGVDRPSKLPELEANAPLIASPSEAINVFDFEPVFFKNVPPAHIGYMASGIDAEATLKANREAFAKYYLRPRRLVDVSKVDTSVDILGVKYPNPIFICPTAATRLSPGRRGGGRARGEDRRAPGDARDARDHFHGRRDRGARRAGLVPALRVAQVGSRGSLGEARRARRVAGGRGDGGPRRRPQPGNLLPPQGRRLARLQRLPRRRPAAERRPQARLRRHRPQGPAEPAVGEHELGFHQAPERRDQDEDRHQGILTAEDAKLAVANGVDGLVVSNHGGRGEDSGRATIDVLPEVVDAVQGKILVLIDGGFRRGTDIAKALAMARTPSASGGRTCGDLARSGSPAWRRFWKSCAPKRASR